MTWLANLLRARILGRKKIEPVTRLILIVCKDINSSYVGNWNHDYRKKCKQSVCPLIRDG